MSGELFLEFMDGVVLGFTAVMVVAIIIGILIIVVGIISEIVEQGKCLISHDKKKTGHRVATCKRCGKIDWNYKE